MREIMSDKILKKLKDEKIGYVDLRFTDVRGKMQHVTFDSGMVDEDFFEDGTMFDGSSISGWKGINESDMVLKPDADTAGVDPFYQQETLTLFCDVLEPDTGAPYNRDPRGTCKAAEMYLKSAKVGDVVYFGPEAEFLFLTTCAGIQISKTQVTSLTRSKVLTIQTPNTMAEIWAIVRDQRVAIFRSRRLTMNRICVRKCSLLWRNWACNLKSITMKSHRRNMNSA